MPSPEKIEALLSSRLTRGLLHFLTKKSSSGTCRLDRILAAYDQPDTTLAQRVMYFVPFALTNYLGKKAGATRGTIRKKLCEHLPTKRAMINTARGLAEYGLQKPQTFSAPLMVVWNFTQACNFDCPHCYQNAKTRLDDELSLEKQKAIIDELDYHDVPLLAFSGGEPLMAPNFWPVVEYAGKSRKFHISVATNGSLITKDVAKRFNDVGVRYVEISIDSADPDKHDHFRGRKGYWEKAIDGIRNVVERGEIRVGLASTITKGNFDELEDLIQLAKDLGTDMFYAFNFIPTGRAKDMAASDLTPQQREEMLKILYRHLNEGEISIVSSAAQLGRVCMQHAGEDGFVNTGHYGRGAGKTTKLLAKYIGGCGAGRCYCAIQPNGMVTPCVFMPVEVGDLRKQSLMDIWQNSELMKVLRDRSDREGHCSVCDFKYHCGGCRARSHGYFGDIRAADPGCIYNQDAWDSIPKSETAEPIIPVSHGPA